MNGHFRPVPPRDPITGILEQLSRFSLRDAAWFHRPEFSGNSKRGQDQPNVSGISCAHAGCVGEGAAHCCQSMCGCGDREPAAAVRTRQARRREEPRHAEAEPYTAQIDSIAHRAELIRRCFMLALMSLA